MTDIIITITTTNMLTITWHSLPPPSSFVGFVNGLFACACRHFCQICFWGWYSWWRCRWWWWWQVETQSQWNARHRMINSITSELCVNVAGLSRWKYRWHEESVLGEKCTCTCTCTWRWRLDDRWWKWIALHLHGLINSITITSELRRRHCHCRAIELELDMTLMCSHQWTSMTRGDSMEYPENSITHRREIQIQTRSWSWCAAVSVYLYLHLHPHPLKLLG